MQFDTQEMTIPAHWLVYIFNADCDNLEDGEADWIDRNIPGDAIVDCQSDEYFSWNCDLWFDKNVRGGTVIDVNVLTPKGGEKNLQKSTL